MPSCRPTRTGLGGLAGLMRVVHVIDNLSPGGTEKQCVALVRELARRDVENAVFYFRGGALLTELERCGVGARAFRVAGFRSPRFITVLTAMAWAMRRWRTDVVQSYGFYSNIPGLLSAYVAGVPVRIAGRRDLGDQTSSAQRRLDRWAWRFAQHVVVNADAIGRQLVAVDGVGPGKVVVIRNGVNLGAWPPAERGAAESGNAVVGMVAHFRPQKDHVTFLRAAREILRTAPGVRFWLVGCGPLEQATRDYARELGVASSVEFLGLLEGEALRAAVKGLGVSVLTSKNNEGLPNAVLESMAAGIPVVATAVGGAPEIVEDGVTGYLVPPETPTALADRVICLLKDPSRARRMGAAGRRKIEREFSIERMVDEFHGLYRARLQGQGR